jgi:hypothetical protein
LRIRKQVNGVTTVTPITGSVLAPGWNTVIVMLDLGSPVVSGDNTAEVVVNGVNLGVYSLPFDDRMCLFQSPNSGCSEQLGVFTSLGFDMFGGQYVRLDDLMMRKDPL